MKQIWLTVIVGLSLAGNAMAQDVYSSSGRPLNRSESNVKSDKLIDPQRLIYGGWGIFGIASGVTNIGATPILGYRITDHFSAGVGFGYQYLHIKDYFSVVVDPGTAREEQHALNAHFYSPSIWMRYIVWNNIFAHVEYEHNISSHKEYTNDYTKYPPPVITKHTTITVPSLLAGGGIRQPISDRASMVFMALYDVLQNKNSPYLNTVAFRLGINIGF